MVALKRAAHFSFRIERLDGPANVDQAVYLTLKALGMGESFLEENKERLGDLRKAATRLGVERGVKLDSNKHFNRPNSPRPIIS